MDQDDSMLSTPSSHPEDNEDNTFAHDDEDDDDGHFQSSTHNTAHVAAQVPQNDHLNAAAPGELSPPRSQSIDAGNGTNGFNGQHTRSTQVGGDPMDDDDDDEEDEGVDLAGSGVLPARSTATGKGVDTQDTYKPGAAWKSKKAQDEMQRAWDQCVDRDFTLKEYGDVMAGRIQVSD